MSDNTVVAEHRWYTKSYKIKTSKTISALNERFVFPKDTHNLYLHTRYMQALPDTVEPFSADDDKQASFFFYLFTMH